ncbi:MAG: mechanosensitive ion channel family protein [Alphaproteobacteria bacterium]|nr:mechanosensitive ion channel family protein [Alphaproteobacteria bacterium]
MKALTCVKLLLTLLFALWAVTAPAAADSKKAEHALNAYNETLKKAEEALKLPDLRADQLQKLRSTLDKLRADALTNSTTLAPEISAAQSQLDQLGPKPESGTEDGAIVKKRDIIAGNVAKLQGIEKQLEIVALSASQISARAAEIERDQFFQRVFEPSQSILNPALWYRGAATVGRVSSNIFRIFKSWLSGISSVDGGGKFWAVIFCLALALAGGVGVRRLLARFIGPDLNEVSPSALSRLWRVFRGLAINILSVLVAYWFAGLSLDLLGHLPLQIQRIGWTLMAGSVFVASVHALTQGVLAPARSEWRLAMVEDAKAVQLRGLLDLASIIVALGFVLRELGSVVFLPPAYAAPVSAFVAAGVAAILSMCLLVARPAPENSEVEPIFPNERPGGFGWVSKIRIVLWILIVAVAVALVLGYVSLARFMMAQFVVTGSLLATLYLAHHLIDELVGTGFGPGWAAGEFLRKTVGLSEVAIARLGLLMGTLGDFLLVFIGLPLVATQWAYNLADFKGWITTIFFGFRVGGVTISFATIVSALLAFAFGLIATRLVTTWLDGRVLARTQVDRGIRDSIRTGAGYLGFALAALFALSYAGVDFSNIAIIAGALGVGIGFGLQSIVNNFVSGLILLAERPIKVGDWIAVTGGEGYVTQINVRSTEIKTFDNCSVIVPNSSLISEPVRNWTHEDTRGRVKVPFGVAYSSDPDQVREIVLECVEKVKKEHRVLLHPAPQVMFMNFGASSLDFELRIHIPEVDWALSVASALRFEILGAFREAGVEIPFPQQDVNFRDIDRLETAMAGKAKPVRKPRAKS